MRAHRAAALVATLAAAATLTSCGVPVGGSGPTATVTTTVTAGDGDGADGASAGSPGSGATRSDDPGTVTGAGRPLDEGGLRAALPSAGDVGDGWVDDEVPTIFESTAETVSPASCAPLVLKGPGWDEVKRTERARVQANFRRTDNAPPPSARSHIGMWAYSFDEPYPVHLFDEAGARVADCATFELTQVDTGNQTTYETAPLTFPALGDRTLAYRLTARQTIETLTMDFVVVKVGHNTVTVANGVYSGTPNTAVTERVVRTTLERLEE